MIKLLQENVDQEAALIEQQFGSSCHFIPVKQFTKGQPLVSLPVRKIIKMCVYVNVCQRKYVSFFLIALKNCNLLVPVNRITSIFGAAKSRYEEL